MNRRLHLLKLLPLTLLAVLLAACGAQEAASWPGISANPEAGAAYVAYNQNVYAVDLETGKQTWRFPAERSAFTSFAAPQLQGEHLLVSGYDNVFYALDPANGSQRWSFGGASNRYIAPALTLDGQIYAPNADHKLYALDSAGVQQWSFTTGEPIWGQPAGNGSVVYLTSMDHMLYALDAQTGSELWRLDLGGTVVGTPLLGVDGLLYVGTLTQSVVAVDTAAEAIAWTASTEGWVWAEAALVDDVLVVGDLDGYVYALDAATGRQLWRGETDGAITGAPTWYNDSLYVINETGSLYAFGLDGGSRQLALPESYAGALYGTPVVAGDLLLLGLNGHESVLIALDNTGSVVWSFTPES